MIDGYFNDFLEDTLKNCFIETIILQLLAPACFCLVALANSGWTRSQGVFPMSKDKKPQCPFIQRFSEDLRLTGKSERTLQSYSRNIRKLSEHLGHDPNQAAEEDIRKY